MEQLLARAKNRAMFPAAQLDYLASDSPLATIVPPAQVYDLPAMLKRCMDDRELAAMLFEKFHTRLSGNLTEIDRLLESGDLPAAQSLVHSLKGEAGSLSASRLHEAAARLQDALRSGAGDLRQLRESLQQEVEVCLNAYPAALANIVGTPTGNIVGTPTGNNARPPKGNNA